RHYERIPAEKDTNKEQPLSELCLAVLPLWTRQVEVVRAQSGDAITQLAENFSQIHQQLGAVLKGQQARSEEHTSELQSRDNLVCRLLLEKKKRCSRSRRVELE